MKKSLWIALAAGALLTIGWQHSSQMSNLASTGASVRTQSTQIAPTRNSSAKLSEAQFVLTSFGATHATPNGYSIHSWSPMNQKFESISTLNTILDKIVQELRMQKAKKFSQQVGGENILQATGQWDADTNVTVTLSSFENLPVKAATEAQSNTTLLIIRVDSSAGDLSHFSNQLESIERTVKGLQLTPQISACIKGFTNARMGGGQKEALTSEAFDAVKAHRIEGLQSSLVTSISGYSSLSSNNILTNGQHMNLQVATHYDAYHHRTNVIVGTPIITEAY